MVIYYSVSANAPNIMIFVKATFTARVLIVRFTRDQLDGGDVNSTSDSIRWKKNNREMPKRDAGWLVWSNWIGMWWASKGGRPEGQMQSGRERDKVGHNHLSKLISSQMSNFNKKKISYEIRIFR